VPDRLVIAMGGGGFSSQPPRPSLDAFIVSSARRPDPRVCFLPTASGDDERYVRDFYRAFTRLPCRPSDLGLFLREMRDLRGFLLAQDVIYVGGGNTANLMAVWRVHGLDTILREAWEAGVVLCGLSAGMNCWFESSVTDSFGSDELRALHDGLGLIEGSACPHYDGEELRRPTYLRLVQETTLPAGYAADDGAALVFAGTELREVVTAWPGSRAFRVRRGHGQAEEEQLATRILPH
jgi:peptidase E